LLTQFDPDVIDPKVISDETLPEEAREDTENSSENAPEEKKDLIPDNLEQKPSKIYE
jgi:hypothetical protein